MKKFLVVFLMLALLLPCALVMAEAVDAAPPDNTPLLEQAEFFDAAVLGTFAGAAAAAEVLILLIKWLFHLEGTALRITVVTCSIVTVFAGKFLGGDSITGANVFLAVINGGVVAATLMKLYEVTVGRLKE